MSENVINTKVVFCLLFLHTNDERSIRSFVSNLLLSITSTAHV